MYQVTKGVVQPDHMQERDQGRPGGGAMEEGAEDIAVCQR